MGYDCAPLVKIHAPNGPSLQYNSDHSGCGKGRGLPQLSTNLVGVPREEKKIIRSSKVCIYDHTIIIILSYSNAEL